MSPSPTATSGSISVLVADSNQMQAQLLTSALRRRPEFRIHTCAMDLAPILKAASLQPATVAVLSLDHSARVDSQLFVLHRLHIRYPGMAKILLVDTYDRDLVVSAFRSGARGLFCIAETNFRVLCKCIQRVASGQIWVNTQQLNYLIDLLSEVPSLRVVNAQGKTLLTPREQQVVALVAEGLSNKDVARELGLSEHTIKKYLFRIFDKLGISTRVELVLYAVNHGEQLTAEWLIGLEPGRRRNADRAHTLNGA